MRVFRCEPTKSSGLMKSIFALVALLLATRGGAWTSYPEFENSVIQALDHPQMLLDSGFTNQLAESSTSSNVDLRIGSLMVRGICARQDFLSNANAASLDLEMNLISNAVEETMVMTSCWQFATARLLYAGTYTSRDEFGRSYLILTNGLASMGGTMNSAETNALQSAILRRFDLAGLSLPMAYKVLAGMSAAGLGLRDKAFEFAEQLPSKYSEMIHEFAEAKCP